MTEFSRPSRRRVVLAATVLLIAGLTPSAQAEVETIVCGQHLELKPDFGELPEGGLKLAPVSLERRAATIILDAQPELLARPDALAAWNRAVAIWEAVLDDNVTVTIEGDFQSLPPGVLGGTGPRSFQTDYNTVRNAMVADRASDESFLTQLPTAASVSFNTLADYPWSGNLVGSKAVLRALGFDMSFDDLNPDATLAFSTGFESDFDYDPSDGIDAGKFDFEAIVVHEIGHALGFSSRVDLVDGLAFENEPPGTVSATVLDVFRLLPGDGASNFTSATRQLITGDVQPVQVFWDGTQELGLSLGVNLGDGRQASHWKADELTGTFLGIMDPTLSRGDREELSPNDLRAFGLIGWDIIPPGTAAPGPIGTTYALSAQPNPFNPSTTISFEVPAAGPVQLKIYDAAGREVRTLVNREFAAGPQQVDWNGRTNDGRTVASGVYFAVIEGAGGSQSKKLALVK